MLPGNLHITVSAVDYMSLVISMPAVPGQTGYCGNFNGDPDDDAEPVVPSWDRPIGSDLEQVAPPQVGDKYWKRSTRINGDNMR